MQWRLAIAWMGVTEAEWRWERRSQDSPRMPFVYLFAGDPLNSVLGRLEASLVSKWDLGQPGYTEKLSQHPFPKKGLFLRVLLSCMFMHNTRNWCLWRSEVSLGPFGPGVMDCCELPCWCWELDLGPLQEQMLKTIKPFCQPHSAFISILVKRQN